MRLWWLSFVASLAVPGVLFAQEAYEADVAFPRAGDQYVVETPPTLWMEGDTITGHRQVPLDRVDDVEVHLVIDRNQLQAREECVLRLEASINEVPLGTLEVRAGDEYVDGFYKVDGGITPVEGEDGWNYGLTLRVPESVAAGCGAVILSQGRSTWHLELEDPQGNARPRGSIDGHDPVDEGSTMELHVQATDPEGEELTYGWDLDGDGEFDDGEGPTVVFDATDLDGPQEVQVAVEIQDAGGATRTLHTTVAVANVAPSFSPDRMPETRAAVGIEYVFIPMVTDPAPADQLSFQLVRHPADMVMAEDGSISWTPQAEAVGITYPIRLQVSDDDGDFDVLDWSITVVEDPNVPWVFAGQDQEVDPGCVLVSCEGNDPRERPLRYRWSLIDGPTDVVFRDQDAQETVVVLTKPGDYTLACVAIEDVPEEDGPLTSPPDEVILSVRNLPPIADPGFTSFGKTKQRITLDGRRSIDPNGEKLRYRWEQTRGATVRISGMSNSITSFYPTETDIYCFQLTVQDRGGLESEPAEVCVVVDEPGDPELCQEDRDCRQEVCVKREGEEYGHCDPPTEPNANPVAWAGQDQLVQVGDTVELQGGRSFDRDSGQVFLEEYVWAQTCGPEEVQLDGQGTRAPTFVPRVPGRYCFQLVVRDADGHQSLPDEVQIVVETADNGAPWADAGPGQVVMVGQEAVLDGTASRDPDWDELNYHWVQVRGPRVTLDDPSSPVVRFCPSIPAIYQFVLTVDDGEIEGMPDEVWVTVEHPCNRAPVAKAGRNFVIYTDDGDPDTLDDRAVLDGRQTFDPDAPDFLVDHQKYLRFQWVQIDGLPVDLQLPFTRRPWFRTPRWGIYTFRLFVLDSWPEEDPNQEGFHQAPDCWMPTWSLPSDVTVVVNDRPGAATGNSVPVADAGPDTDCLLGEECYLNGTRSHDPDGDELEFHWVQTGGSRLELADADKDRPHFHADELGEWSFRLTVNDGFIESLPDDVLVRVRPNDNLPPVCRAGHGAEVKPGTDVVLNGCGSLDANGDELTFTWTQTAGDPVELTQGEDDTACKAYFTVPEDAAEGDGYTFQLVVNDGRVDCEEPAEVTITVVVPKACDPQADPPQSCTCEGDLIGQRHCLEDGSGWSDCMDCHPPRVCVPDEVVACPCEQDGWWGEKTCNGDGTEWSECTNCQCSFGCEQEDGGSGGGDDGGCAVAHGPVVDPVVAGLVLLGLVALLRR